MFLLALPLRIPYTALIFVAAAVCSVFEKRETYTKLPQAASLITRVFTEEEPMNLALLLMLMFSTPFVRGILYLCLLIWAFLMWSEWGQEMLDQGRESGKTIYGLPAMKPVIDFGMLFRVELNQAKCHIEVALAFLSVYLILIGRIAPIFPIFFWQYIRIKYVVSNFTQVSFRTLDTRILKRFLPAFIYGTMIEALKRRLLYFVDYKGLKQETEEEPPLSDKKNK